MGDAICGDPVEVELATRAWAWDTTGELKFGAAVTRDVAVS
jgi:hypothetical protein